MRTRDHARTSHPVHLRSACCGYPLQAWHWFAGDCVCLRCRRCDTTCVVLPLESEEACDFDVTTVDRAWGVERPHRAPVPADFVRTVITA